MQNKKETSSNALSAEWKQVLLRMLWLLLIPLALILARLAGSYPWVVERVYSRGAYPYISAVLGGIMSAAPFSVAEFFVYGVILSVVLLVVMNVIRLLAGRRTLARFVSFLTSLAIFAGVMLNIFYALWGFNYMRPKLGELMELPVRDRPVAELNALCHALAGEALTLRGNVAEDEAGVFTLASGGVTGRAAYREYFSRIPDAYASLGEIEPLFSGKVYSAKNVLASVAMSYGGIAGIFMPFTNEANVNTDQPPLLLLSSAAHENAHALGVAREDEANFVGYLACIASKDASIAYSGVMLALIESGNRLHDEDAELYSALLDTYSEGMLRDIRSYNSYWDAFEGPIEEAVTDMNDGYLKFNAQDDGVKSYGMMVDLLLAYYIR